MLKKQDSAYINNSRTEKDKLQMQRITGLMTHALWGQTPRHEKYALLKAQGLSVRKAKRLAGYAAGTTHQTRQDRRAIETVEQARARLSQQPGMRFGDSADFYRSRSISAKACVSDQLRARTRLDALLGYDAPAKAEVAVRSDIRVAVGLLRMISGSPASIDADLTAHAQAPAVISSADDSA